MGSRRLLAWAAAVKAAERGLNAWRRAEAQKLVRVLGLWFSAKPVGSAAGVLACFHHWLARR
jgi:hypothetical protein